MIAGSNPVFRAHRNELVKNKTLNDFLLDVYYEIKFKAVKRQLLRLVIERSLVQIQYGQPLAQAGRALNFCL